jgi:hypothetical protein
MSQLFSRWKGHSLNRSKCNYQIMFTIKLFICRTLQFPIQSIICKINFLRCNLRWLILLMWMQWLELKFVSIHSLSDFRTRGSTSVWSRWATCPLNFKGFVLVEIKGLIPIAGVGVVLLTVSAVAWRLTANESGTSSCRAMLGFGRNGSSRGDGGSEPNRVFVPRLPPSYGRPHHPYAGMYHLQGVPHSCIPATLCTCMTNL